MRTLRTTLIVMLVAAFAVPAAAGDLAASASRAAEAAAQQAPAPPSKMGTNKAVKLSGAVLFAGGMTMALYSFINNQNGEFSEFGEADAVDKKMGAIGMGVAFGGGLMMYLGSRADHLPSVTVHKSGLSVGKKVSW